MWFLFPFRERNYIHSNILVYQVLFVSMGTSSCTTPQLIKTSLHCTNSNILICSKYIFFFFKAFHEWSGTAHFSNREVVVPFILIICDSKLIKKLTAMSTLLIPTFSTCVWMYLQGYNLKDGKLDRFSLSFARVLCFVGFNQWNKSEKLYSRDWFVLMTPNRMFSIVGQRVDFKNQIV